MKVLLKRSLYLGDVLYEPNVNGTVLPDQIGGRKVVLFENEEQFFENSKKDDDKQDLILPRDVKEWSDEEAKKFTPEGIPLIRGHPKIEVPLSSLHPHPDPVAVEKEKKVIERNKANEAKELLDPGIVGKK